MSGGKGLQSDLVQTSEGGAHEMIINLYHGLRAFFEVTEAPAPLDFVVTTGANITAAAICDLPVEQQEAALARAVEMMTLCVRSTRLHRASTHEGGHA